MSTRLRLTPHFVIEEFDSHDGARVPRQAHQRVIAWCEFLGEPLRARFGPVTILSGYRSERHNRDVHGAARSWHRYELHEHDGVAADFKCQRGDVDEWAKAVSALLVAIKRGGGIGRYHRQGFVHADTRSVTARWTG